jgi:hypothetical protein
MMLWKGVLIEVIFIGTVLRSRTASRHATPTAIATINRWATFAAPHAAAFDNRKLSKQVSQYRLPALPTVT